MISPESTPVSAERFFKLEPMEGKKPLSTSGAVDPRIFKDGEDANRLKATMDPATCLWSVKYEKGVTPTSLEGTFTGYRVLMKFLKNYFYHRNINITEVP